MQIYQQHKDTLARSLIKKHPGGLITCIDNSMRRDEVIFIPSMSRATIWILDEKAIYADLIKRSALWIIYNIFDEKQSIVVLILSRE